MAVTKGTSSSPRTITCKRINCGSEASHWRAICPTDGRSRNNAWPRYSVVGTAAKGAKKMANTTTPLAAQNRHWLS